MAEKVEGFKVETIKKRCYRLFIEKHHYEVI